MKIRQWFAAVCAVILFAMIGFGTMNTLIGYHDEGYGSSITVDKDTATLSSERDHIKILQLTDIQTSTLEQCMDAYPQVKRIVEKTNPDLIVLTGDNISDNSSHAVLSAMIRLFDGFEIPWALVFGNHDRNSLVSMPDMCKALENSKYGIFKTGDLDDRYGNYYYNLSLRGELVRSLIFLDSAKTNFTSEQVAWYKDTVTFIQSAAGRLLPSFAFFHIPILETQDAHDLYAIDPSIGTGVQHEPLCMQTENTGFFDAVKALGSTDALFYGHDHVNNTILSYQGVLFCYGLKTGSCSYWEKGLQGGNLITVTADSFQVERIYSA